MPSGDCEAIMKITSRPRVEKPPQTPARLAPDPVEQLREFCRREHILVDARDTVSRKAVCAILGVSLSSVDRYLDKGTLPVTYRLNGHPKFGLADLAALWQAE